MIRFVFNPPQYCKQSDFCCFVGGPPAIAEKPWSRKSGFCPDASAPNLSGWDLAYPSISKFCPDTQIRALFCPAMSRSADLTSALAQTTSRASQGVENGYITSKMYILTLNCAISTVIMKLLSFTSLFWKFQGCCGLFSTDFQSFITQCTKEYRMILLTWAKIYCSSAMTVMSGHWP